MKTYSQVPSIPLAWSCCALLAAGLLFVELSPRKATIGATTAVTEVTSGIELAARVDTGAGITSLHCVEIEIEDESPTPEENLGRRVRILLENRRGDRRWVETKIVDYSEIRTNIGHENRYHVRLSLRCRGVEKETTVTLSDRSRMSHALLLGRNFLEGDFVVDVSRDMY